MTASREIQFRNTTLRIGRRTLLMGVLNVTPDSFSGGSVYNDTGLAVEKAERMVQEGADILDIGGESSRPGALPVPVEEELARVLPVLEAVKRANIGIPVSIDTYKSRVAEQALMKGADIINDITALRGDPAMAGVIAAYSAGVVLMHMKGNPENMQMDPVYGDIVEELLSYLACSVKTAEKNGICPEKIFIDPGIGFGKTTEHNLVILRELRRFTELGKPVLIGTSRKSFIGAITGKPVPERIFGTAGTVAASVMNGAFIIRAHDVREMRDVIDIVDAIKK
ncbi:MAG: dihydropteroate synthase [Candidatus Omnitrophota bacterium]